MKILIADHDPVASAQLQRILHDWGYEVMVAGDGAGMWNFLHQADPPMMAIIDWTMPGENELDIFRNIRAGIKDRNVYLIVASARDEAGFLAQALDAGADDYLIKPYKLTELRVRVQAGRRVAELEDELNVRSSRDALTGLYSRGAVLDVLERELERRVREHQSVSVIYSGIDQLKRINETHGHLIGDEVLREIARRVRSELRPYDALGRHHGEKLLTVLPACDASGAMEVAERIRMAIVAHPIESAAGEILATISMGVATVSGGKHMPIGLLLQLAENALGQAIDNGRNRAELASLYYSML